MKYIYGCFPLLFLVACSAPEPRAEQVPAAVQTVQQMDCKTVSLPAPNPVEEVSCMQTGDAYCAFFPNGRPFYCATKDGQLVHRLNKWGSSLTVSRFDTNGKQLDERYYAYGQLTRGADYNNATQVLTRFWWDENGQIRLYRYHFNGRVLDKYYFRAGHSYVRYPDGNDMGEINGPWELKGLTLFTDGKELYTLPDNTLPAPDTCATFAPLCAQKDLI